MRSSLVSRTKNATFSVTRVAEKCTFYAPIRLLLNWIKVKNHLMWAHDTRLDSNYSKDRKSRCVDMRLLEDCRGRFDERWNGDFDEDSRIIPSIIEDLLAGTYRDSLGCSMFINLWTSFSAARNKILLSGDICRTAWIRQQFTLCVLFRS